MRPRIRIPLLLAAAAAFFLPSASVTQTTLPPLQPDLILPLNQRYICEGPTNRNLVKVKLTTLDRDAVSLASGCTGRIGRLEIETSTQDLIKFQNGDANAVHDLVIESGWGRCRGLTPGAHQDGVQAMGGRNVVIRNFVWDCGDMNGEFGSSPAQGFVVGIAGSEVTTPTGIVVEHSVIMPGAAHTVAFGGQPGHGPGSVDSGVRDSVLCPDRTPANGPVTIFSGAGEASTGRILVNNIHADLSDPRCQDTEEGFQAALAWATGDEKPPPPPPTTTTEPEPPPPTTTTEPEPDPVPCDEACVAEYEERIRVLTDALVLVTAERDLARDQIEACKAKLRAISAFFHARPKDVMRAYKMHAAVHAPAPCTDRWHG